jgi:hypothetical protein
MDKRSSAKVVSILIMTVRICNKITFAACCYLLEIIILLFSFQILFPRTKSDTLFLTTTTIIAPISTVYRGNEEGPWNDGIPFDGSDIWQFTVFMNYEMVNKWVIQPGSFLNLGQDRQARCWPWTNDRTLPYTRNGVDHDRPRSPTGELLFHSCVGPFGCAGKDHKHNFAGAA